VVRIGFQSEKGTRQLFILFAESAYSRSVMPASGLFWKGDDGRLHAFILPKRGGEWAASCFWSSVYTDRRSTGRDNGRVNGRVSVSSTPPLRLSRVVSGMTSLPSLPLLLGSWTTAVS
jgi:hypothetical protein